MANGSNCTQHDNKVMKSARIVHLTSVHSPSDVRIFHKECKTLAAAGYDVTLIAPCEHEQEEVKEGIRLLTVPKPGGRRERMTRTVWQVYRVAVAEDAHLYHFHDPELLPIGMLLKLLGKHVIYDVHEDVPKQVTIKSWIPSRLKRGVSRSIALLENLAGKVFSGIIAATPAIAKHFPTAKIVIVQNFPIVKGFLHSESFPYAQRSSDVVYIGNISEGRGLQEMLAAISVVPAELNCRLLLAGKTYSSEIQREILSSQVSHLVKYLGWLDRDEIPELLHKVSAGLVVLHPSSDYIESYPVKMFEYMAAGLPFVASDFPLWQQIVEDKKCGLLTDPCDPKAIAFAIQWLLEHPQEAEAMGKRGQEAVLTQYNWSNEVQKLLKLYGRLLDK